MSWQELTFRDEVFGTEVRRRLMARMHSLTPATYRVAAAVERLALAAEMAAAATVNASWPRRKNGGRLR